VALAELPVELLDIPGREGRLRRMSGRSDCPVLWRAPVVWHAPMDLAAALLDGEVLRDRWLGAPGSERERVREICELVWEELWERGRELLSLGEASPQLLFLLGLPPRRLGPAVRGQLHAFRRERAVVPEGLGHRRQAMTEAVHLLASWTAGTGFLVGDRATFADLSVAAWVDFVRAAAKLYPRAAPPLDLQLPLAVQEWRRQREQLMPPVAV
jgi:glutathione S-transferase